MYLRLIFRLNIKRILWRILILASDSIAFLPARRYASAGLCESNASVRLSVCLSVRLFVCYNGGFLSRFVGCFVARDVPLCPGTYRMTTSPLTCDGLALISNVSSDSFVMAFSSD